MIEYIEESIEMLVKFVLAICLLATTLVIFIGEIILVGFALVVAALFSNILVAIVTLVILATIFI
jgi:hypothetical protein